MVAAAMAYAMGVKLDDIRKGFEPFFDTSYFQAPGRMNVFDQNGFKVILDYGHNPAAVDAMCTLVDRLAQSDSLGTNGKRICVLAAPVTAEMRTLLRSHRSPRIVSIAISVSVMTTAVVVATKKSR